MLMSRKDFYDGVHQHGTLKKVWDAMLNPQDQLEIAKRLAPIHTGKIIYNASHLTDYLRGISLRCDVLPVVWGILKNDRTK